MVSTDEDSLAYILLAEKLCSTSYDLSNKIKEATGFYVIEFIYNAAELNGQKKKLFSPSIFMRKCSQVEVLDLKPPKLLEFCLSNDIMLILGICFYYLGLIYMT